MGEQQLVDEFDSWREGEARKSSELKINGLNSVGATKKSK